MNLQLLLDGYPSVLLSDKGDDIFVTFRLLFHGMASARLAKFLNYASRFLDYRECYLEIGTYSGFSLLSAGYENSRMFYGIDNFSENYSITGPVMDELKANLARYPGNYIVISKDFREVDLKNVLPEKVSIGILFIDGKHTYEDVMDTVRLAKPFLSEKAIVVFDDLSVPGVKKAVEETKKDPCFSEIFVANSFFDQGRDNGMRTDPYIHNGFSVMTYAQPLQPVS